jgi:hypothetical protein
VSSMFERIIGETYGEFKESMLHELETAQKEAETASRKVWTAQHALAKARRALQDASAENRLAQERLSVALAIAQRDGYVSVQMNRPSYLGVAPVSQPPEGDPLS